MKMWKKLLLAFVALIVLLLLGGMLLPSEFSVERTITIAGSRDQIYQPVSTLRDWPKWTAWNPQNYPNMTYSYDGAESGVGAKSNWADPEGGNGTMEITSADPDIGIEYTLQFDGFPPAFGTIKFEDGDDGKTTVRMKTTGNMGSDPMSRYFGLLMDGIMGPDFEKGLLGLKNLVESQTKEEGE